MTASNPALLPDPPLFDVTDIAKKGVEGSIERFGLDEIELAPNARREISADGLERLAGLLMRAGQLVPLHRLPRGPRRTRDRLRGPAPLPGRAGEATSSPAPKATRASSPSEA